MTIPGLEEAKADKPYAKNMSDYRFSEICSGSTCLPRIACSFYLCIYMYGNHSKIQTDGNKAQQYLCKNFIVFVGQHSLK